MQDENPWKVHESKVVYKNPWMVVREDKVTRPDGSPGTYGLVDAQKIATGAVALTPENNIYLVGQYRYPMNEYTWEIPEGGSDPGEDPFETIKRELKEETGLIARNWSQLGGEVHLSNCISSERGYLYLARDLEMTEATPDVTEVLKVDCVPFKQALEWVESGKIKDSLSLIAILRVARLLKI